MTMTPTQLALLEARKQRLARIKSAATPTALPEEKPAMFTPRAAVAAGPPTETWVERQRRLHAVPMAQPCASPMPRRPAWFAIEDDIAAPRLKGGPSVREIQKAVCAYFGVELIEMLSERRNAEIVRPRQIAVHLCKRLTLLSLPKMGRLFGGRDHTTMLAANRKITALLATDEALRRDVEALLEQFA